MALTPTNVYAAFSTARAAGGIPFATLKYEQMARGIANAIVGWAVSQPQNVALSGIATGTAGAGVINAPTTKIIVAPSVSIVKAAFTGAGVTGPVGDALAVVVSTAISSVFTASAQYVGVVAGVGAGADVSKIVVANPATLQPLLVASMGATMGGIGPAMPQWATALAGAISGLLLTGTGAGTVTGPTGPSPATGTSTSVIV